MNNSNNKYVFPALNVSNNFATRDYDAHINIKPQLTFTPSQIKTTVRPNTFTAQDAGIYSNAELDQFWNRIVFSKPSDTTLQLLVKALSYSFISSNTPN